jgi:beta-glucosidase/6-phospho-beta-glucosidase/beta-galactosidase
VRQHRFLLGVATAAHQVEGNLTNNDWALFTTTPAIIARVKALSRLAPGNLDVQLQPAEEAVLHADLDTFTQDLSRAKLLGINAYRFSVEWSRLQPTPDAIDPTALTEYYVPVVRALVAQGIEPLITLNHMSLPTWVLTPPTTSKPILRFCGPSVASKADPGFQASLRGWENPATIDKFLDFVRLVVETLKDEGVRYWLTFDEPVASMIGIGYLAGVWPPGFSLAGAMAKQVYFTVLRVHVRVYDLIKSLDPTAQVGVAHAMFYCKPSTGFSLFNPRAATEQVDYFYNEHLLNTLTSGRVDVTIHRKPARRVYQECDQFFGIDPAQWKPKLDFIGLNYYRGVYVYPELPTILLAPYVGGAFTENLTGRREPYGLLNDLGWEIYPEGLYQLLKRLHTRYGLPLMITENGMCETEDRNRAPYIVAHLEQVHRAQAEGVAVLGYMYWSLVDTFEWSYHYIPAARFGLFTIDRDTRDPMGQRILRRRITEGALALRFLAQGGELSLAAARFGSIDVLGERVQLPTKSPGALWVGTAQGKELSLYLTRLTPAGATPTHLLGMVFDGDARRWIHLDELAWDAASKQLIAFQRFGLGVPERAYAATLIGDDFFGSYTQAGTTYAWQARRAWLEGIWTNTSPLGTMAFSHVSRWEAPLPVRTSDWWRGKFFMDGSWRPLDAVTVQGANVTITTQQGSCCSIYLTATVAQDVMQGTANVLGGRWQATRVADDVLL